ncbi:MAG: class I SAM-dependent methyltransferase, partial [Candidatus Delongbacteria bacterium]|nr:class I SAM-dependent methyltransferase [Candidatus Delongbacteria bacterium]
GVDISQTAIEWAKEKAVEQNSNADFRVGSVLDLKDYPDNFFDFVFDAHCFHCIIGKDRKLFLESALRVLKPGGFFLSNTMCGEFILEEGSEKNYVYDPESRCLVTKGFAQRYIGLPNDIIKEIKDAGFKILDTNVNTDDIQDMLRVHATKE